MLRDIRKNYQKYELREDQLKDNPLDFFKQWLEQALENHVVEPTVMVLSTMKNGQPDSRVVLLKELTEDGFVFYTNYNSSKGKQISENSKVALNFFWAELERQIRVKGEVFMIDSKRSNEYFKSRPRDSQIGAFASRQSEVVESKSKLEKLFLKVQKEFEGKSIPKPEHWGGYLVKPSEIEFWQGRPNRLHDRILYYLKEGIWKFKRLQP